MTSRIPTMRRFSLTTRTCIFDEACTYAFLFIGLVLPTCLIQRLALNRICNISFPFVLRQKKKKKKKNKKQTLYKNEKPQLHIDVASDLIAIVIYHIDQTIQHTVSFTILYHTTPPTSLSIMLRSSHCI